MPRLKITVAYTGAAFQGWQVQEFKTRPRPRTVQGELERVIAVVLGEPARVHGSGRTDAGVHADAQVAHVDIPEAKLGLDWQRSLNALLPHDLAVISVEQTADDFHARMDATAKHYSYTLWLTRRFVPPRLRGYVWDTGPLDVAAMDHAAAALVGTHDFASFVNAGSSVQSTVRTITSITRETPQPTLMVWHFSANGFLKQMVRNIMGLLVYTGRGVISPESITARLEARTRCALASPTAPAHGLTLSRVQYE